MNILDFFRRKVEPPEPEPEGKGSICFDTDEYPITDVGFRDGKLFVTGTKAAKDYGRELPFEANVAGEYEIFGPDDLPVVLGFVSRGYPMTLGHPDDSYSVTIHIEGLGTTREWFKEHSRKSVDA